jgi:hypothetical protein
VAAVLLLSTPAGWGEDRKPIVVIVNKSNRFDTLRRSQVEIIFLRKVSRWPWGPETIPIDLPERSPVRETFVQTILNSSFERLAVYWIDQKVTRSLSAPMQAANAAAAKSLVASKPGAIAYIPAEALDDTVKAIKVE